MDVDSMSDDEKDPGDPAVDSFIRRPPDWCSLSFTEFKLTLDEITKINRNTPIAGLHRRGSKPRVRKSGGDAKVGARVTRFLPINCYDKAWLDRQPEWVKLQLDAKPFHDLTISLEEL